MSGFQAERRQTRHRALDTGALVVLGAATLTIGGFLATKVPMTSDEAITVAIVDRPLPSLVRVLNTQGHAMGPYHLGLAAWLRLGDSDWWIRLFSVIGGTTAICMLYVLSARWVGRRVAFVVCVATLVNPFFVRYLVDARTYAWLAVLGLGTLMAIDNLLRRERTADVVWLGVAAGLGMASHVVFAVLIVAVAAALLVSRSMSRHLVSRLAVSGCISAAIWLPALYVLVTREGQESFEAPVTPGRFIAITSSAFGSLPTSAVLTLGILSLLATSAVRRSRDWPRVCALSIAILPPLLLAFISLVAAQIYISRYLFPVLPFATLAAVMGYLALWRPIDKTPALAIITVVFVVAGILGPSLDDASKADPRAAADFLSSRVTSSDSVLFDPPYVRTYVARYWGYHPEVDPMLRGFDESEVFPTTAPLVDVSSKLDDSETLWLVRFGRNSSVLDQIQIGRMATEHLFGELTVIELARAEN